MGPRALLGSAVELVRAGLFVGSKPVRLQTGSSGWFLTGFMGAGKSTVGRLLAAKTGWDFLDIDHQIEASTGSTLQDDNFFDTLGEQAFRQIGV